MKSLFRIVAPAALLALAACGPLVYGKVDVPSVQITQSLPQVAGAPTVVSGITIPPADNLALLRDYTQLPPPETPFVFDTGDILVGDDKQKAINDGSSLVVSSITLKMVNPAAGASFTQLTKLSIKITPPASVGGTEQIIAQYDAATDEPPQATSITLKAAAPATTAGGLLKYFGKAPDTSKIQIYASGRPPAVDWKADMTIDFAVVGEYNVL